MNFDKIKASIISLEKDKDIDKVNEFYLQSMCDNVYELSDDFIKWLKEESSHNSYAQIFYCRYLLTCKYNANEVLTLCQRSVDKNNPIAQDYLGDMYFYSSAGLKRDNEESVRLFRLSADQGFVHAIFNLGWMHSRGYAIEKNVDLALEYFIKSYNKGYSESLMHISLLLKDNSYDIQQILINKYTNYDTLTKKVKILEETIVELELRPPHIGGTEYNKAKESFQIQQKN